MIEAMTATSHRHNKDDYAGALRRQVLATCTRNDNNAIYDVIDAQQE